MSNEEKCSARSQAAREGEQKPVAYFRAEQDGTIMWGEDCCCVDAVYPSFPEDEGSDGKPVISLPVYTAPVAQDKLREALIEAIAELNEWSLAESGEEYNNPKFNAALNGSNAAPTVSEKK